ncbi:MAG TPA: aldehyde dehydrogenase family protein [Ktedonobacterales bacterium]|nr:aldehyde dehydrogenase family protein [Ktedonobacterales bacterium]
MTTAAQQGSPQFPQAASAVAASDQTAMDSAIAELQARKDAWVATSVPERIAIVDRLIAGFAAIAPRWVDACIRAKEIAPDAPTVGEEWSMGPYTLLKQLRQLRTSLDDIRKQGVPRIPGSVKTRPDGQVTAQVFPQTTYDKLFFGGLTAEVWMEPGVTQTDLPKTQAVIYANKSHPGRVALVLGAGNVSGIGPLDAFNKLFVEDQVALFKTNPVNAYLGPLILEACRALVERDALRVVYGGAAEGAYLCAHPGIDEVHITGSDKTFDAIVWGPGAEGAARKAAGQPLLNKRITGELGNVSPVIVVPGPWSASDLAYQAEHIATMLTTNAGFNCNATRVIVQHEGWGQREALLAEIHKVLSGVPSRAAFYPGARDRYQSFLSAHPEAKQFGDASGAKLPWMLIEGVAPDQQDDIVFTTEAFCSLFAETALPAGTVPEYIERAVAFANENIWGSLNVTLLAHPKSLNDPAVAAAVEQAVANLRYGTVAVNYWAASGFVIGTTTWGAFPGHPLSDIRSGTGVVHNTLMFDRPQKSVMRGPWRATPVPPWFVTRGRAGREVFRRLAYFEAAPSAGKAPGIALAALRG